MGRGFAVWAAGAVALVAVVFLAAWGLLDWEKPPRDGGEVAHVPSPTVTLEESSARATLPAGQPSPTHSPGVVPETGTTPEPTNPLVTPELLPATPPWPAEAPALPPVSSLASGGLGGSAYPPGEVSFVLDVPLVAGPERMTAYVQLPESLGIASAGQLAEGWGVVGAVYQPFWMADLEQLDAFTRRCYIVVDEPRQLIFEGTELVHYRDRSVFPAIGGRWSVPQGLPPVEQAILAAEQFLGERGLLDQPYQIDAGNYGASGSISFYRTLDSGFPLLPASAIVTVDSSGRVGRASWRPYALGELGIFALASSQQAWELLRGNNAGDRLWLQVEKSLQVQNPRFWARTYQAGQRAELFAPLHVLPAAVAGQPPHLEMNNLVLAGADLNLLAQTYRQLVETSGDMESPLHVWGLLQEGDGYLTLRVDGWENVPDSQYYWSGTIQRRDQQSWLQTDDGSIILLPDAPADLADGAAVFVNGVQWQERLEWTIVQERLTSEGPQVVEQPAEITALVERMDLVYVAMPMENAPIAKYADYGYRTVQPVWRFSGHTDQGAVFAAFVQAVADGAVLSLFPATGGQ